MKQKNLDYPLEIKAIDEQGAFSGYATVWGDIDAYGETLAKGSVKKSLRKREPAMLWQHDARQPIGVWTKLKEDDRGLLVEGKLALNATIGKDTYALMQMGAVKGLSVGFLSQSMEVDAKKNLVTFTEIDLWEISAVTFPALESATIDHVKSFFGSEMPTEREVEQFLRDSGLSKNQAMTFISKGYRACLRDSGKEEKSQEDILRRITLLSEKLKNVSGNTRRD